MKVFKAFVTKYALTKGILEVEVEDCKIVYADGTVRGEGMVKLVDSSPGTYFHGEGKDWHLTYEGAVARARVMRDAKLKTMDKKREKLVALFPATQLLVEEK